jgi:hypothetical protein
MWPKRMHDRIYSQNETDAHGNNRNKFYNKKQQRISSDIIQNWNKV